MQIDRKTTGQLDIVVRHSARDLGQPAQDRLTLSGGKLDATFVPLHGN